MAVMMFDSSEPQLLYHTVSHWSVVKFLLQRVANLHLFEETSLLWKRVYRLLDELGPEQVQVRYQPGHPKGQFGMLETWCNNCMGIVDKQAKLAAALHPSSPLVVQRLARANKVQTIVGKLLAYMLKWSAHHLSPWLAS